MKAILTKINEVYDSLVAKEANVFSRLLDLDLREKDIKAREIRNTEYESAQAVLDAAKARNNDADIQFALLEEERVAFDNWAREERQALKDEEGRLAPLQDAERQLAADRAGLYAREQALEVEKREFKVRYIEKIKAHFANTGGAPNPDEIA